MDTLESHATDDNAEEQQRQSEEAESTARPTLSQVKKSWGFRRTTIAKREFLEEVRDLSESPPLVRRGRGRKRNQTPGTIKETPQTQTTTRTAKSVIDELQWSAPSSPASEDSKPASEESKPASEESKATSEASAGAGLDPSIWQDVGSAFHTAFSLLGGEEGLSMTMSDALGGPSILEPTNVPPNPPVVEEPETDSMDIAEPVTPDDVADEQSNDVISISSQEDTDDRTLIQIKEQLASKDNQGDPKGRAGKGGKGRARGKGRGRGRGRGKGRGRGRTKARAAVIELSTEDDDINDEAILYDTVKQQHSVQVIKENDTHRLSQEQQSPVHFDIGLTPAQSSDLDCMTINSDSDNISAATPGQYDDAEEEGEKRTSTVYPSTSDSEGNDARSLCDICQQKHNNRFMICCDTCQKWYHGDCVGINATDGDTMKSTGQEFNCPTCTSKKESLLQSESDPLLFPELCIPECLTLSPFGEEETGKEEQLQDLKEAVTKEEEKKEVPAASGQSEPEPEGVAEMDSSVPLCIGPSCPKQALPDSVYCGPDCIRRHAAAAMKTISVPKAPVSRGRGQRKAETTRPAAKAQRSGRTSKRLAAKAEQKREEEQMSSDEEQEAAGSTKACDPSLTEAQAPSIPPSMLHTASNLNSENIGTDKEAVLTSKQNPEDPSADVAMVSQPAAEAVQPQRPSQENTEQTVDSDMTKQQPAESDPSAPPTPINTDSSPATSASTRHHETGALMVSKTTYVIPKKPSGSQPTSGHPAASMSPQKPSSAPTLLTETRNLPVSPAPSAPSSRPSQPNNLVRQSIQRSLTGILFKRVTDCEDLEMSESEAAKLVASIEMEMFDIFRNTDSKYMNKYRTIMFNLKDPRNKGLLYRVVRGEIGPFRLVRMSQKDMQAVKAPEPSPKDTAESSTAKEGGLQKPEAVKLDLPTLNPARPNKKPENVEQKKTAPPPILKTKTRQPIIQTTAVPDITACMLKDTTSEHKAHLFDLKCKICTGQMQAVEEQPKKKKAKVSLSRDKNESSWRRSVGSDSPLLAPPDSPDMSSSTSFLMDLPSTLAIDSPKLTIVESPASPVMESPASPTLDSPASPVMDSPASPTQDSVSSIGLKRGYAPVVIPAVSTVSVTQRDPRTAANRFSPSPSSAFGCSDTTHRQAIPHVLRKDSSAPLDAPVPSRPAMKPLPKSILMKPSSTADPRLFGISSRTVISQSPAEETVQFLAKQDILWKGFLNMLTVAKFVTKGYLVSGSAENLKADLPDTIQIGGRILPQTVWDYVAKLKTSLTKELCVIRFQPATEEEEVAYVSLFSYFSSRGRFGVVANGSRSIKDVYLVPLSAEEPIPSILQPLEGPGLETNRPNLLLGLAIVQKTKRPGSMPQEIEEKRPKVHLSTDPTWIPKPPVLYGSDKLEIFQPYDPETPASNTSPQRSPSCPGSPSDSSSSNSVNIPTPSLLTSTKTTPPVSTSASVIPTQSVSSSISDNNPTTTSGNKKALPSILKTFFTQKSSDSTTSSDAHVTSSTVSAKKVSVSSEVSRSMMDPIVQQYGQKSKVKKMEEDKNDFDRPYDPEEEYDPAMGYKTVAPQTFDKVEADDAILSDAMEDDVAYDPEDETIFQDIQSETPVTKPPISDETLDSPSCSTPVSTSTPVQMSMPTAVTSNLPTGTVVVSAATLNEQQRMLEELNKQIEEQKRQLKEQEEALRQQREAVGMFMAHFSVSDSLMSPPGKSLPPNKQPSLQNSIKQIGSNPSESTNVYCLKETSDSCNIECATDDQNVDLDTDAIVEQDQSQENAEDSNKSAGEIEDSDVAYDPEDESLFDEIQDDVFKGSDSLSIKSGHSGSHKGTSPNSYHSRKHRSSPKKRSRHDRDRHRSPSKQLQHHSPSHSRRHRERERHRKTERDRSRHRARDHSERQGHHRKGRSTRRHSHGQRRSSSSSRKRHSMSPSPKQCKGPLPEVSETSKLTSVPYNTLDSRSTSSSFSLFIKNDLGQSQLDGNLDQDKILPPCSQKQLHNMKLEISAPQKFPSPQKSLVTADIATPDDAASALSSHVEKSSQDPQLNSKIVTTIPLRLIDPPIRDSPESPDPEPQFVKPSDTVKEENKDPVCHPSLSSGDHTPDSNTFCPSDQDAGDQTNQTDKQLQTESAHLMHSEINYPGSGPEIRQKLVIATSNSFGANSMLKNESRDLSMKGALTDGSDKVDLGSRSHLSLMDHLNADTKHPNEVHDKNQLLKDESSHTEEHTDMKDTGPNLHCKTGGLNLPCNSQEVLPPNIGAQRNAHPDCRGSRIGVASPAIKSQSQGLSLCPKDLNWSGSESDKGNYWRGFDHSRSDPGSEVASIQDKWRIHQLDREGANRQKQTPAVIGECQEFGPSGLAVRDSNMQPSKHAGIGLGTSCFLEPRPENIRLDNDIPLHDRRGPVPAFMDPKETGPALDIQRPGLREEGPSDFVRAEPERTSLALEGPVPNVSGHLGPQFRRPAPDQRNPALENKIPELRESDVRGAWPERRSLGFVAPGPYRRGPCGPCPESTGPALDGVWSYRQNTEAPEFKIPGPEIQNSCIENRGPEGRRSAGPDLSAGAQNGGLYMDGAGPEQRGIGGPDFKGQQPDNRGLSMDGSGLNRRRPGGPQFRGPLPENRGSSMEGPRLEHRQPGGQDFRVPGPDNRGLSIDGPNTDRRGPGGPEFRRPYPENRGSCMESPMPDRRGPGNPEFRGPGPENRDLSMDGPWVDGRGPGGPDFRLTGHGNRNLSMDGPRPEMRGPGGPQLRGPPPENRDSSMESPWPEHRELGSSDFKGPGPDNRNFSMDGLRPDRRGPGGPQFSRSGSENRDLCMDGLRGERRGPGGPQFRGPLPENRGSSMEGPWPEHREPRGPEFRGPGPENRGLAMDGPGPERRGPGPTRFMRPRPPNRGVSMDGSEPDRRVHGGPDFRIPGPDNRDMPFDGPGDDHRGPRGPDFRGLRSENRGLSMDGPGPMERGSGGPNFRGSCPENRDMSIAGPGPDRKMPGGPDHCDPGFDGRDPTGNMRSEKKLSGGPDFIGPGPEWRGPNREGPVTDLLECRDPNFRAEGPGGRGSFMPRRVPGGPDFSKPGPRGRHPTAGGPRPDRSIPGGLNFGWSEHEKGPIGLEFKGSGFERRRPPIDGSLPVERRAPEEQNYHGPGFDRRRGNMPGAGLDGVVSRSERTGPDIGIDQNFERSQSEATEPDSMGPSLERPEFSFRRGMRPPVKGALQPIRKGTGRPDLRESDYGREEPESECLQFVKQEPEHYNLRESGLEMSDPHFEDPEPEWVRSHGPDFRKPGVRPHPPHSEILRHDKRDDWGGSEQHNWRGPFHERRGRGSRGLSFSCERPIRQFPRPRMGALDQWNDSGDSISGPDQNNPHMLPSRPGREHLDNWREPDYASSRLFYQNNEGQGEDSQPGPSIQDDPHMENHKRQPALRGRLRAPRGKGPGDYVRGPDSISPYHSRREFDMENCDRRSPGGLRLPGPGNRNLNVDDPVCNDGPKMVNSGPGTQRFEHNLRQERRGAKIRDFGSNRIDVRGSLPNEYEFGSCSDKVGLNVMGPVHDSRGPDAMHREAEQRGPHQVPRYQDSSKLHLVNRPIGCDLNSGGKMFPGKPPRPRGALLPTPTEGLIRFPNYMTKHADVSSIKQKFKTQPAQGQHNKSVGQQGQVTSQELGSPKINTPAGEKTTGDKKRQQGDANDDVSVQTKTT